MPYLSRRENTGRNNDQFRKLNLAGLTATVLVPSARPSIAKLDDDKFDEIPLSLSREWILQSPAVFYCPEDEERGTGPPAPCLSAIYDGATRTEATKIGGVTLQFTLD